MLFYDAAWYPMILVGRTGTEVPKEIVKAESKVTKTIKVPSLITKTVKASSPITKTAKVKSTIIP